MDFAAIEKLTLLGALAIAVLFLWRGYVSARDETIATLREELKECRETTQNPNPDAK